MVSAVSANNMDCLEDIEGAVMELAKSSCRKLNNTNNKGKMVVSKPAIPHGGSSWTRMVTTARGPKSVGGCDQFREPMPTSSKCSPSPHPSRWTTRTGSPGCGWSKRPCSTSQSPSCRPTQRGPRGWGWSKRRCCLISWICSPGCCNSKAPGCTSQPPSCWTTR